MLYVFQKNDAVSVTRLVKRFFMFKCHNMQVFVCALFLAFLSLRCLKMSRRRLHHYYGDGRIGWASRLFCDGRYWRNHSFGNWIPEIQWSARLRGARLGDWVLKRCSVPLPSCPSRRWWLVVLPARHWPDCHRRRWESFERKRSAHSVTVCFRSKGEQWKA